MLVNKLFKNKIKFNFNFETLLSNEFFIPNKKYLNERCFTVSLVCNDEGNEKLSSLRIKGNQIKIAQHYFEHPVQQPRPPKGQRRIADLTGLKSNRISYDFFK